RLLMGAEPLVRGREIDEVGRVGRIDCKLPLVCFDRLRVTTKAHVLVSNLTPHARVVRILGEHGRAERDCAFAIAAPPLDSRTYLQSLTIGEPVEQRERSVEL